MKEIIKKIILTVNRDAEKRAALLAQEEHEARQKELAEQEEIIARAMAGAETDNNITFK